MNPKTLKWVSIVTLIISIVTLWMVWQMQSNLAHSNVDAAGPTLSDREKSCGSHGGSWSEQMNADGVTIGGECEIKNPASGGTEIHHYDANGNLTGITR